MADTSQIAQLLAGGRLQPNGYRGTVAQDATANDALLMVNIESFDTDQPFAARWQPRPDVVGLPVQGVTCIVLVDENHEAWVPVWWPYGD